MMEAWSSDDLEADVDAKAAGQRLADQIDAFNRSVAVNAAQRIDALYTARTPEGTQQQAPNTTEDHRLCTQANGDSQAGPAQSGADATVCGGRGEGLLNDPYRTKTDLNMTRKAIRSGWNVPDSAKPRIVGRLVTIVDQSPDDGDAIKAASVLRAMDSQDQDLAIKEHELARVDNGQQNQAIKLYGVGTPIDAV